MMIYTALLQKNSESLETTQTKIFQDKQHRTIPGFIFLLFHLKSVWDTGYPALVRTRWVHRQAVELLLNTINFISDNKQQSYAYY